MQANHEIGAALSAAPSGEDQDDDHEDGPTRSSRSRWPSAHAIAVARRVRRPGGRGDLRQRIPGRQIQDRDRRDPEHRLPPHPRSGRTNAASATTRSAARRSASTRRSRSTSTATHMPGEFNPQMFAGRAARHPRPPPRCSAATRRRSPGPQSRAKKTVAAPKRPNRTAGPGRQAVEAQPAVRDETRKMPSCSAVAGDGDPYLELPEQRHRQLPVAAGRRVRPPGQIHLRRGQPGRAVRSEVPEVDRDRPRLGQRQRLGLVVEDRDHLLGLVHPAEGIGGAIGAR